jgi:hypothetical protein
MTSTKMEPRIPWATVSSPFSTIHAGGRSHGKDVSRARINPWKHDWTTGLDEMGPNLSNTMRVEFLLGVSWHFWKPISFTRHNLTLRREYRSATTPSAIMWRARFTKVAYEQKFQIMLYYEVKVLTRRVIISGSYLKFAVASASWTSIESAYWGWLSSNSSSILSAWTRALQEMTRSIQ